MLQIKIKHMIQKPKTLQLCCPKLIHKKLLVDLINTINMLTTHHHSSLLIDVAQADESLQIEGSDTGRPPSPQGLRDELVGCLRWMKIIPKQMFIGVLAYCVTLFSTL